MYPVSNSHFAAGGSVGGVATVAAHSAARRLRSAFARRLSKSYPPTGSVTPGAMRNGAGRMPAVGRTWDDDLIEQLADYLKTKFGGQGGG